MTLDERGFATPSVKLADLLERLWIVEPLPAWLPTRNRLARLSQAPKHHLADPALAARLLGLDAAGLLVGGGPKPTTVRDGPLRGQFFESLVTMCVRVLAQGAEARVFHLRRRHQQLPAGLTTRRRDRRRASGPAWPVNGHRLSPPVAVRAAILQPARGAGSPRLPQPPRLMSLSAKNRAGHPAMPSPVFNQRSTSPLDQATSATRRRRCSIIASTPATSERALEPVAGSISGTWIPWSCAENVFIGPGK